MTNDTKGAAVAYVRISSEEQLKRSATNIKTQTAKCADAAQRAGLHVVKTFTDQGESAFTQAASERPQLQKMLAYLREHRATVKCVVFENLSRLARRVEDQAMLLAGFKRSGLSFISVDEPNAADDSAAGRMALGISAVFNQYSSDSLSERVTYRMQAGASSGRFLHRAPLGYINGTVAGVKNILPDPERAELVRKAFTLAAEGHSLANVLRMVTALGLRSRIGQPLKKTTLSQLLHNRIFCGWVKSGKVTARASFQPLVSEELFNQAQDALAGRVRNKAKKRQHEDWPLRRFVLCGSCSKPMTSGWVKNRAGKPYGYFFCEQKGCRSVSVRKEVIERDWLLLLGMMEPSAELLARCPEIAKATWNHRKERAEDEQRQLKTRLIEQQGLNKQAIAALVQGKISEEDFTVMKQAITEETKLLEHGLLTLEQERATLKELMETTGIRLQNLSRWYQSACLSEKIELAFSLFPDGLRWSEDSSFLNTGNRSIFQMVEVMVGELEGVGGRPRT